MDDKSSDQIGKREGTAEFRLDKKKKKQTVDAKNELERQEAKTAKF